MDLETRTKIVQVRFTPKEYQTLCMAARAARLTVSGFLRSYLFQSVKKTGVKEDGNQKENQTGTPQT